jgi:hypothetical protein
MVWFDSTVYEPSKAVYFGSEILGMGGEICCADRQSVFLEGDRFGRYDWNVWSQF